MAIATGYNKKSLTRESYQISEVYKKIKNGKPVIIYMKHGIYQHYVVAVGVKKNVTEKTVKENDILIIDPYEGKIRKLTGCPYSGNNCYSAGDFQKILY